MGWGPTMSCGLPQLMMYIGFEPGLHIYINWVVGIWQIHTEIHLRFALISQHHEGCNGDMLWDCIHKCLTFQLHEGTG